MRARAERKRESETLGSANSAFEPSTRKPLLVSVQMLAGNRAVSALLDPVAEVQRDDSTTGNADLHHADSGNPRAETSRPLSAAVWSAYSQVSYEVWQGEEERDEVWDFVGGNVGRDFAHQNTCATRLSWALNHGGIPIPTADGRTSFYNDPKTVYHHKAGDGQNYIVRASDMDFYLRHSFGPPDGHLRTGEEARGFEDGLVHAQGAVFAGHHHSGFIMKGYRDAYLFNDPKVLPVDAWKLA